MQERPAQVRTTSDTDTHPGDVRPPYPTPRPLPSGPLAALRACERNLLAASLDLATARPALTGTRQSRAVELATRLDALISTCQRLATVVEGDQRASRAAVR
ncbi:hypothetical protein [Mycobacterium canetti]|uniref:hypothetical protein n=1 Tax=Mycobacterium canetti TaxID=78331 RepID=UPI00131438F1|nr:hypothetical protein [Mycobacterium canetti]